MINKIIIYLAFLFVLMNLTACHSKPIELKRFNENISIVGNTDGNYLLRIKNPTPSNCNNNSYFETNDLTIGYGNIGKIRPLKDFLDLNTLKLIKVFNDIPLVALEDKYNKYSIHIMYCSFTISIDQE